MITAAMSALTEGVGIPLAERVVLYPSAFTDKEWKNSEKRLKVSATGIGQALRVMEKTAATLDAALAKAKTLQNAARQSKKNNEDGIIAKDDLAEKAAAAVPNLHAKHLKAILAARTVVTATARKVKPTNAPAAEWLDRYEDALGLYFTTWRAFDLGDFKKVKDAIARIDDRIRTIEVHKQVV